MTDEHLRQYLIPLVTDLCRLALEVEVSDLLSGRSFTRAPEGKTIEQGATTISLGPKGREAFGKAVQQIYNEYDIRVNLSVKEIEEEVVTVMFAGSNCLESGTFDADSLVDSLITRLRQGIEKWIVYLPIADLIIPSGKVIHLASGIICRLESAELANLEDDFVMITKESKWKSPSDAQLGLERLTDEFKEVMNSSDYWYIVTIEARREAAYERAMEQAELALDIVRFFAGFVGEDPNTLGVSVASQASLTATRAYQVVAGRTWRMMNRSAERRRLKLDNSQLGAMLSVAGFEEVRKITERDSLTSAEYKLLLGIQQFGEATRLVSPTLKLVWYLSALETVLAKETEGDRHKKVERRIRKLLGSDAADLVVPLYDKRRKPVHYGYRNRLGNELVTPQDLRRARVLATVGIHSVIGRVSDTIDHEAMLDAIDAL